MVEVMVDQMAEEEAEVENMEEEKEVVKKVLVVENLAVVVEDMVEKMVVKKVADLAVNAVGPVAKADTVRTHTMMETNAYHCKFRLRFLWVVYHLSKYSSYLP